MKIKLCNIGRIRDSEVDINSITLIAGENGSGKSTVGKALFATLNAFSRDLNKRFKKAKIKSVRSHIQELIWPLRRERFPRRFTSNRLTQELINIFENDSNENNISQKDLQAAILSFLQDRGLIDREETFLKPQLKQILEILNIPFNDMLAGHMLKSLNSEFNQQISNLYDENKQSSIDLNMGNETISIQIKDNSAQKITGFLSLQQAFYLDSPFVLDDLSDKNFYRIFDLEEDEDYDFNHRIFLQESLLRKKASLIDDILGEDKLEATEKILKKICDGEMEMIDGNAYYALPRSPRSKKLDIRNLATGMKIFVILKTLIQKNLIREKGVIIFDEPEVHLHPEWQIVLAEFIVVLQKELELHILINTHSPYFVDAIETYTKKYETSGVKFYLMHNDDEFHSSIKDVTLDTDQIYNKLARPFQDLEDERWRGE